MSEEFFEEPPEGAIIGEEGDFDAGDEDDIFDDDYGTVANYGGDEEDDDY